MGPREKLRWILRGLGAGVGAVALVAGLPLVVTVGAIGIAGTLVALGTDPIGKDAWTPEQRARRLAKKKPKSAAVLGFDDDEPPTAK